GGLEMALLRMIAFRPDDATAAPAPRSDGGATAGTGAATPSAPTGEAPTGETPASESRDRLRTLLDQGPEASAGEQPAPEPESVPEPEPEPEPAPAPMETGVPAPEADSAPEGAEPPPAAPLFEEAGEPDPEPAGPEAGPPEAPGLDTSALGSTPPPEEPAAPGAGAGDPDPETWRSWVAAMPTKGLTRELLRHTAWRGRSGNRVTLALEASRQPPDSDRYAERIAEALALYLGETVKVELVPEEGPETPAALAERAEQEQVESAREAIQTDPMVQQLCDTFDARVDPATIRPREDGESTPDSDTTGTGG
ncbi:MAG: DNA polymerase III subunit gamma/tau C-terminal domain-containing protein, partial [Pseudomonadota bacterium]